VIAEFRADADLHGQRINLSWAWIAPSQRPGLRLLRRQRAYPDGPEDGLAILDLGDLFRAPNQPWARIAHTRYLVPNSTAEGGLCQAQVRRYFDLPAAGEPSQVVVRYYETAAGLLQMVQLEEVSRVVRVVAPSPPWASVETLDIFATPGGGPEVPAGQVVVSTGHADGVTPDRFQWIAPGDPPISVDFDRVEHQRTTVEDLAVTPATFQALIHVVRDEQGTLTPLRTVWLDEAFDPDTGDWKRHTTVQDRALSPEIVYYYALFAPDPAVPGGYRGQRDWRASAIATGRYGLDERLYQLLPALHKQYDEPAPDQQGEGQLRRYLQIFGLGLDQMRSLGEGLRARHDVLEVRADFLPHLARWIGWEPDQTLGVLAQRNDVRFAPDIFETVGSVPNVRALVNRVTGWECRVKEFVHNVFLTNAPETVHLWELWGRRHDGVAWSDPSPITRREEGFDGRPAAVLDGAGVVWLFWHALSTAEGHSDRRGRREIWLRRLGVDPTPRRAMLNTPDDAPRLTYTDEYPAAVVEGPRVWLFWCSDREGSWDIWARPYDGLPGSAPVRLTEHPAQDRHPAAVRDGVGQTWLFWQSDRRGPTDIWARVHDGVDWGLPTRLTAGPFRHETPAAAVDGAARIWLFWSTDLGDRRKLFYRVHDAGGWGPPQAVPQPDPGAIRRDEAPAAIFWNGEIWLFWHSNRDGRWQIWGQTHDGAAWGAPFPLTERPTADKEPAAVVDGGGGLRVVWRSKRRGDVYKSRTVDVNDAEMLARLGAFEDRARHTYDTGLENQDWYARGTVGLYLTPDTADSTLAERQLDRVRAFVEPFRPLPVRFVWILDLDTVEEVMDTTGLITDTFTDEIS
jgi:phage tail-like protein